MQNEIPTFRVFIKPGCPWCHEVIDYLTREKYSFELVDVIADSAAFEEMRRLSGQSSAPTMTAGETMLADFGVDELIPFLEEQGWLRQ